MPYGTGKLTPIHRANRIRLEGSKPFRYANENSIAQNGVEHINFGDQTSEANKYLPFNSGQIINNSSSAIKIWINNSRNDVEDVPAGTILNLDNYPIGLRGVSIECVGSTTITAGQVVVTVSTKSFDIDKEAYIREKERQSNLVLGFLGRVFG